MSEPQPQPDPAPNPDEEPTRDNEGTESLLTRGPDEDTRRTRSDETPQEG